MIGTVMIHHVPMYLTFDNKEAENVANYLETLINQSAMAYSLFSFEGDEFGE